MMNEPWRWFKPASDESLATGLQHARPWIATAFEYAIIDSHLPGKQYYICTYKHATLWSTHLDDPFYTGYDKAHQSTVVCTMKFLEVLYGSHDSRGE